MARWTVRTKEGELVYESFGAVERAWLQGLVEPDDELLEEGTTRWRRAGSVPILAQARRQGDQVWGGTQSAWAAILVVLGSVALYLLVHKQWAWGGILAIVVTSLFFKITYSAFRKTKPHG